MLASKLTPMMAPVRPGWRSASSGRLSFVETWLPRPWPAAHPLYQQWTLVLTALGLYSAFTTCFRLAFVGANLYQSDSEHGSSSQFNSFGLFIDMVFVADSRARPAGVRLRASHAALSPRPLPNSQWSRRCWCCQRACPRGGRSRLRGTARAPAACSQT